VNSISLATSRPLTRGVLRGASVSVVIAVNSLSVRDFTDRAIGEGKIA